MFGVFMVIAAIIYLASKIIKEKITPEIPAENWSNMDLYNQDVLNGVPIEERLKNLQNGKYKRPENQEAPHKDANGNIIIENLSLYEKDWEQYDVATINRFINEGRYNLSPEVAKKHRDDYFAKRQEGLKKAIEIENKRQ